MLLTTHAGQSDTGPRMSLTLAVYSLGSSERNRKELKQKRAEESGFRRIKLLL